MAAKKNTFFRIDVCIQTLEKTIFTTCIFLNLPKSPTLDHFRALLLASPLGKPEKDIFFPSWTKSLHMLVVDSTKDKSALSWDEVEDNKLTIDTTEKLHEIITKQEENDGTVCLVLQQCRSKRYSRKKDQPCATQVPTSPVSISSFTPPSSPSSHMLPNNMQGETVSGAIPQSPMMNDLYRPLHTEPMYYEQPIVPITIVAPPSIYPQCYTIPLGMTPASMSGYNMMPGHHYMPHLQTGYFGYGVH